MPVRKIPQNNESLDLKNHSIVQHKSLNLEYEYWYSSVATVIANHIIQCTTAVTAMAKKNPIQSDNGANFSLAKN